MRRWSNGLRILALCGAIGGCAAPATNVGQPPAPSPPPPAVPSPLTGVHWKLVQLDNDRLSIPDSPREPHFVLLPDGRATGSGGCNRLSSTYTIDGRHLRFAPVLATKMFCPGAMDYEQPLFDVLNATGVWRFDGKQLELFDVGGLPLARFEARTVAK